MKFKLDQNLFKNKEELKFWIITWVGEVIYYPNQSRIRIELTNSSDTYFHIKNLKKSYKKIIELPVSYISVLNIGTVFDSDGVLVNYDKKNVFDTFQWRYSKIYDKIFTNEFDKFKTMDLLRDMDYPLPIQSSVNKFRYYRKKIPYKNKPGKFYLILIPEFLIHKFFFLNINSVEGINSIIESTFLSNVISKAFIREVNGKRIGVVEYNNDIIRDKSIIVWVSKLLFLRGDSGIKSIKQIGSSSFKSNSGIRYLESCMPINSDMNFNIYGRFLSPKKNIDKEIINVFLAIEIDQIMIKETNVFSVDELIINKKIERNSTENRNNRPVKNYNSKKFINNNLNKDSFIEDKLKSIYPNEKFDFEKHKQNLGFDIPVTFNVRNDQINKWELDSVDIIISDEESITTNNRESSKDSKSKGSNLDFTNNIDKGLKFTLKVIEKLNEFRINGEFINQVNNQGFYYIIIDKKGQKFNSIVYKIILETNSKTNYFYLLRFPKIKTGYICLLSEINKNELSKEDIKLLIIKSKEMDYNWLEIRKKKALKNQNIVINHLFKHQSQEKDDIHHFGALKIKNKLLDLI